ncbi:cell division protein ZapB [Helicobacter brantae]|uniref:DUF904 domain-containing protein n=1 Tax=Helicobacter brantae TaxID=375927 RepID=A0A3D8IUH2_9HELI|nr:cell division protein ZapB [Helicobacter brantae]RDU68872.1 hypothetical protein CQA58_07815 [Helicobacter brantae]
MSVLEKLISKIDGLCQKIQEQKEEIASLQRENEELKNAMEKKEVEYSQMLENQTSESRQLEALFERIDEVMGDKRL